MNIELFEIGGPQDGDASLFLNINKPLTLQQQLELESSEGVFECDTSDNEKCRLTVNVVGEQTFEGVIDAFKALPDWLEQLIVGGSYGYILNGKGGIRRISSNV